MISRNTAKGENLPLISIDFGLQKTYFEYMGSPAGAKEKFVTYVEPELAILLKMAQRLTGNKTEAEDLLQDCLVRAFSAIESFDGEYPRAWLFTILRNTHINRGRIRKHILIDDWTFLDRPLAPVVPEFLNRSASSEETYLDTGLTEVMLAGIQSLSPQFKEVIYLVDIEGFSYDEAAVLLDIKTATVTSRLNRARTKLRNFLLEHQVLGGGK